jgi:signal transduction histidine kinase
VEKTLAGTIGTAAAHTALKRKMIFTPAERRALQDAYAEMLASLSLTPEEVKRKIDYYRERDHLLTSHAEELERNQDQLRRLSGAIMASQEKERRAVARELHDELAQLLTALRLDCAWLQKRLLLTDAKAAERASSMDELVDRTIDEVRKIAIRLRPGVLDDLGHHRRARVAHR